VLSGAKVGNYKQKKRLLMKSLPLTEGKVLVPKTGMGFLIIYAGKN
jgi:hypothetical protein